MSTISKKKLNELLALSNDPKIELLEDNQKSYKIEINGDKDKVKKSSFENKVLDFMSNVNDFIKEQREFNKEVISRFDNIESRIDVLEKDVNVLKSFHKNDIKKLKSKNKK